VGVGWRCFMLHVPHCIWRIGYGCSIRWLLFYFCISLPVSAQQFPSFSQYTFNPLIINPAVAGSDGYTTVQLLARNQWLGFSGAPISQFFSIQTRLYKGLHMPFSASVRRKYIRPKRSGKVGLGFQCMNDKAGIFNHTALQFIYAYHIKIARNQLSFGLSLNLCQYRADRDGIRVEQAEDNLLLSSRLYSVSPDFNTGVYYTARNFYTGFSIENLTNLFDYLDLFSISSYQQRKANFIAGYRYEISDIFILEPSAYLKFVNFKNLQTDFNIKLIIHDDYWIATTYRTGNASSYQVGMQIKKLCIGYAFDYDFTGIQKYGCGTHEIMIALKLGDNARRYKWLNRY
jgi:type IX secretion system PorP/SprF family membrane protein